MAQKNTKSSASPSPKRRWRFEFGPFGLIGIGLVGTLVMAWAFILGILVGRGYNPESVIPELGRMMEPRTPTISSPPGRTVLQPEDLRFHDTLQERGTQPAPAMPKRSEQARIQEPRPGVQPPPRVEQTAPQVQTPSPEPAVPQAAPSDPRFEFVFQVASFQSADQARALQQRVSAAGIPASVESGMVNGRQWYRVLVAVQGAQAEANHIKNQLQGLGIEAPFLRAKKSL